MAAPPSEAHDADKWRYAGRRVTSPLLDPDSQRVICESPVRLVRGLETRYVRCQRSCDTCRTRYKRHVRRTAETGLDISTHPFAYFVTLTAPGASTLLARWNPTAGACWNRFMVSLRRFDPTVQYFRAAEIQKRGAIHHHGLLLSSVPLTRNRISRIAKRAGYGWMVDVQAVTSNRSVASYLAKYVTKASDDRQSVPWQADKVDRDTGEITSSSRATYRTWSRSYGYGVPMREVKRRAWVAYQASMSVPNATSEPNVVTECAVATTLEASPP